MLPNRERLRLGRRYVGGYLKRRDLAPTEIEETAGYVVQRAREYGVSIPNVEFGYRVVRGVESYL